LENVHPLAIPKHAMTRKTIDPNPPSQLTKQPASGRKSQSLTAYSELKRRLLDNEMQAGAQFLEQELAEMLGMSRTPVREAMIRLAEEGMVEVRPRHGMRVLPVSAKDMREIYEILTSLESTAAEQVARRGLSPDELAVLQVSVDEMEEALEIDDRRRWADADERFHLLLVEYCGNERLRSLVETFWDQAHRARLITLSLRPKPTASNRDHAAVVDAIARRDAEAARKLHRKHRVRSGELLVELLTKYGLTQV
jgi:DNA-binding GntR family transcriptional regulator